MIRLSIVVPLYKSEQYLPKCLNSLLHQDIPLEEYELILVNDGSPDNSLQIAKQYAQTYSNIKVISQENKGASGARNTGIAIASGTYIRFVDPDDFVPKNSFKTILEQIEQEQLDILRFNYQMVDEQYHDITKPISATHINYNPQIMNGERFLAERLGFACYIWTFIYKRSIIQDNNILFYEGDYYDDTPWTPRVILKANRINTTPVIGYYYYIRNDSLVRNTSQESQKKKNDGSLFLIKELCKQRELVKNSIAHKWYDGMIAHCSISLLNRIAINNYDEIPTVIAFLKQLKVFPLSCYYSEKKARRKIRLANISPRLFCILMHHKSK